MVDYTGNTCSSDLFFYKSIKIAVGVLGGLAFLGAVIGFFKKKFRDTEDRF